MRQVISGAGVDTTTAVLAYLAAGNRFFFADLFLIGDYDDPQAVRLTNWEGPLAWPVWGTFLTTSIKRGAIESKIGLEVSDLEITWSPKPTPPMQSLATANFYQLAQLGFFDNKKFRCWITVMPTPGDANTYGAAVMFGGRIGKCEIDRGQIKFTVNSFLDVVNMMVPTNIIELTDTRAAYAGATPPPGFSLIPQFNAHAGSTESVIIADEISPNAHQIFSKGFLAGSFLVFNGGAGATLQRQLARIANNVKVTILGVNYNQITLYDALPWAPAPGTDTFYISAPFPVNNGSLTLAAINAAGSGYLVGDILPITGGGGTGAAVEVMAIGGGGAITSAQIKSSGANYAATIGAATSGGTGSGATFDLTVNQTQGFPYVPSPQQAL
jgi:hypothetical protein